MFPTTSTWDLDEQVLRTTAWSWHYYQTFSHPREWLKSLRILIYIPKFTTPLKETQMTCALSSWQCAIGDPTLANTDASDVEVKSWAQKVWDYSSWSQRSRFTMFCLNPGALIFPSNLMSVSSTKNASHMQNTKFLSISAPSFDLPCWPWFF